MNKKETKTNNKQSEQTQTSKDE